MLLDCCCYLCRQCIPFRRSKNKFKGNFNQLVHLLARWVPIIEYWVGSAQLRPYKVTYLSNNFQNEYIYLISNEIFKFIADVIESAEFFVAIADTISKEKTGGEFAKKTFYHCWKNFTYQVMLFDSSAMTQPSPCLGSIMVHKQKLVNS